MPDALRRLAGPPLAAAAATARASLAPLDHLPEPVAGGDVNPSQPGLVEAVRDRLRALTTPQAVVGTIVEALWATTHVALYPLGAHGTRHGSPGHGYRVEHLPPIQRGLVISRLAEAGTPILLLHGMADNHSIFALLRRGLQRRGFTQVFSMNYSVRTTDVRTAAAQLAEEVEAIVEETHYERIHIVAHSLGGLVARYYATRLGGDERVHTVVTLGSPHHGTLMAHLLPTKIARQLRPGSPLLKELEQPAPDCRTRFIVMWSNTDEAILPSEGTQLRHRDLDVIDVPLEGVGHLSLPILPSVVHQISTSLAQLDSDGQITASVTDITALTGRGASR